MAEILTGLLTYGPLGVFCAVLWLAYTKEKDDARKDKEQLNQRIQQLLEENSKTVKELQENHAKALDDVRKAHTEREKEVAQMLQNYGNSVISAVGQAHELVERLWSIRK